jgi:hypothetical protein
MHLIEDIRVPLSISVPLSILRTRSRLADTHTRNASNSKRSGGSWGAERGPGLGGLTEIFYKHQIAARIIDL